MKIRQGFVSNSSSSSFIITNTTNETKTLVDFVTETPFLIENFLNRYSWHKSRLDWYNQDKLRESAEQNNITFPPNSEQEAVFGDEDGTLIGQVYDYMLRDGGESPSFSWRLHKYLR